MIYGIKKWKDTSIRYLQTTAIIERFLADLKAAKQLSFSLESCNVSSACCGVEGVGAEWRVRLPQLNGRNVLSQKDIMFDYLYSDLPGLYKADGICENEVPENLVMAVNALSTAHARLIKDNCIENMKQSLKKGSACVLSYLTDYGGGHYICVVAYNEDTKEFIYYNSWPDDKMNRNGGIQERFSEADLAKRMRPRYIEITA